jgi:hypothetical protein
MALALLAAPSVARADDGEAPSTPPDDEALAERGARRPAAKDTRAGHWLVSARSDVLVPAGSIATGVGTGRIAGLGPSFGGTVGYGVSRYATVEASASYALLTETSGCAGCSGRSFDAGLGFSYHLAQGIAVDPWASFGMGWRMASFTLSPSAEARLPAASDKAYHGLDVARVALGADFYPIPQLGFGPYFGADFGTFLGRPAPTGGALGGATADPGGATYAMFHVGLRITFDPLRGPLTGGSGGAKAARLTP